MKKIILSFIFLFILAFNLYAEPDKWTQLLYDSIHYVGNDIIIDIEKIENALVNGANPNWIRLQPDAYIKEESILSHFVELISQSRDPKITEDGVKAIEMLFKYKAKLQYCDGTILFWPISYGKYEIVKILLEKGASATFWPKDEIGYDWNFTPIEQAAANGHEEIIELLVRYGAKKLSEKDVIQLRFIETAKFGTISELKDLIKKGADVNTRNQNEETALINAIKFFRDYAIYIKVMYLLDLGADVNLKGRGLFGITTPLHQAIWSSKFLFKYNKDTIDAEIILQELIKKGAFVSAQNGDGETPLHIAAKYNHLYAARLLLESGAKVMPKDNEGKTPLDYAESAEMIRLLKEHGAKEQ
jgi:ankyrin repeat protein